MVAAMIEPNTAKVIHLYSSATAPEWLGFDPVLCVGGSWVVGKGVPDEAAIEAAAREAVALGR